MDDYGIGNREILFRARRLDTGAWIYGDFVNLPNVKYAIYSNIDGKMHLVDIETVSQYTGLKNKNGKKIFEGDIVNGEWNFEKKVVSLDGRFFSEYIEFGEEPLEVIGNIFEDPNLLEK